MTYLSWRREIVLSAIDQMLASCDPDHGPFGDGGVLFNAMMQDLSRSLPAEEIVASAVDLLTAHRGFCSGSRGDVARALKICLTIPAEKHGLERRLRLDRRLVEANAFGHDPNLVLVWNGHRSSAITEFAIAQLTEHFPCQGTKARWNSQELVALMRARSLQCRRTRVAMEILAEDPSTTPAAGTVVLVFPDAQGPRPWIAAIIVALRTDQLPEGEGPILDASLALEVLAG
jgi:hypothetical protein